MSFSTSRSRRGHITTTIYRQTSPEPQLDISEITSSTAGHRKIKRRVIVRPSPSHLSASTSASPAPSSISTHSHNPHPALVQWDLPTSHPPSHQQLSDKSKTPHTTVQSFPLPFLLSSDCPLSVQTYELLDPFDPLLPRQDRPPPQPWFTFN